ncbi:predicted protein [Histoplasma mississippiense (nom. inval.)]|uniref:predicted protein n=1 Tax=Ajellomyces capsulatus (strain NAm1 / WU24) TaxID=2059318 RepID=UPI000157CA22|nr:predicted protein [Histoplasma mississippiense (nom. inval.)]EDN09731.1 predicted protein [Histoplasma mississippiense (nom. inval.)]
MMGGCQLKVLCEGNESSAEDRSRFESALSKPESAPVQFPDSSKSNLDDLNTTEVVHVSFYWSSQVFESATAGGILKEFITDSKIEEIRVEATFKSFGIYMVDLASREICNIHDLSGSFCNIR